MRPMYHLTTETDFAARTVCAASAKGIAVEYRPDSLQTQGFVHGTWEPEWVVKIANQVFPIQSGDPLLCLTIDADMLAEWIETVDSGVGHAFPHLKRSIPMAAICAIRTMPHDGKEWSWPDSPSNRTQQRLEELGIVLPSPPKPAAAYVGFVQTGNLISVSGQVPVVAGVVQFQGHVGSDLTESEGQAAARLCALNALAQLNAATGNLDRIQRVVRLDGYVNSAPGFLGQASVLNGASELLVQVLGERGRHSRLAVGANELPLGCAVEIALLVEVSHESA
jgi:enamine deaminase RidA (YjgF/YER057c/UK114 family)/uncharacterized protein (DUF952 family)